jgi:NAD(P)-dependent dehydrogenase (short-subunit alcohol dehydrogenase family)
MPSLKATMTRIFITGSSDGIGQSAAKLLSEQGHSVVLHARNADRAASAHKAVPQAEAVLVGDLSSISETKKLADDANGLSPEPFDAVIHNAGIGYGGTSSTEITADKISAVFAVNTLAPYILTCKMKRPTERLLYMSSDSHYGGDESLRNATQSHSYGNSKLHDVMLANAFARRWGDDIQIVSMHPGWVRTKMGGSMAPGGMDKPAQALAEWAAGQGSLAKLKSGTFFTTRGEEAPHPGAANVKKQEELLGICREVSGVNVPGE